MPEVRVQFNRHGLGDCIHFAHVLQLYRNRGYRILLRGEENKRFVWQVAGAELVDSGPDHVWGYPWQFGNLDLPDHVANKIGHNLHFPEVMPDIGDRIQLWTELTQVHLSSKDHVSDEARREAERFIADLPRPLICVHTRGSNWQADKSLSIETAFRLILELLDRTGGSVIVLDFDRREPMVGDARCRGIRPHWGNIGVDRLCALYELCDLMIGVDSGPFHTTAFADIPALGVFRRIHPVHCCVPRKSSFYMVSRRFHEAWESRASAWKFIEYAGVEPTAEEIAEAAMLILRGVIPSIQQISDQEIHNLAGSYLYRRINHDERILQLDPDGAIAQGRCSCEQTWTSAKSENGYLISIRGDHGTICTFSSRSAREFGGTWNKFERMEVELLMLREPEKCLLAGWTTGHPEWRVGDRLDIHPLEKDELALTSGIYQYERCGRDSRRMHLLPDGTIGIGGAKCEQFWFVRRVGGIPILTIAGWRMTCHLQQDARGVWIGHWLHDEKMPIRLTPLRITPDVEDSREAPDQPEVAVTVELGDFFVGLGDTVLLAWLAEGSKGSDRKLRIHAKDTRREVLELLGQQVLDSSDGALRPAQIFVKEMECRGGVARLSQAARHLQIAAPVQAPPVSLSAEMLRTANDFWDFATPGSARVAFCPETKDGSRRWAGWEELSQLFQSNGILPRTVDTIRTRNSVTMTAAILKTADLAICIDSFQAHLAGTCGTPCIVLTGPTPESAFAHYADATCLHVTVEQLGCVGCAFGIPFEEGVCNRSCRGLELLSAESVFREAMKSRGLARRGEHDLPNLLPAGI